MSQREVILLLGSNLGDREKNLLRATEKIETNIGNIIKKSKIMETKPLEFGSLNNFLNFALQIVTSFSPIRLLQEIKKIEKSMGRTSDSSVKGIYEDRVIDIDIVKFSNIKFRSEKLEIPHIKHLYDRVFSKKLIDEIEHKIT
ncbi:MAG: 2-amino-4-hydroxy-6-hydroxymethyldihydropteridine diphosphokinase [Flavobacteriaceae bacterium]|jgi:2-amino-4-hydroxy-6-hydroxymethyldihydropteridine diphosphokinase|nr:2-amino-4-hydroxy-6-hydroxymethyldihydropteridine diphosphokinase [Flavobacteriaceae bacterium]